MSYKKCTLMFNAVVFSCVLSGTYLGYVFFKITTCHCRIYSAKQYGTQARAFLSPGRGHAAPEGVKGVWFWGSPCGDYPRPTPIPSSARGPEFGMASTRQRPAGEGRTVYSCRERDHGGGAGVNCVFAIRPCRRLPGARGATCALAARLLTRLRASATIVATSDRSHRQPLRWQRSLQVAIHDHNTGGAYEHWRSPCADRTIPWTTCTGWIVVRPMRRQLRPHSL